MSEHNERLCGVALKAIDDVFADTTVTREETKIALEELRNQINVRITSIPD